MTTAALNNLWTYIQSLSLTKANREWLADKLNELANVDKESDDLEALQKLFGVATEDNESYPVSSFIEDINSMACGKDFIKEML